MSRSTIIILFSVLVVFLIVVGAIGYNALGQLLGALGIIAIMAVALALIFTWLIRIMAPHKLALDKENHDNDQTILRLGFMPKDKRGNEKYTRIKPLDWPPAPEPVKQIAAPSQGIHFSDSDLFTNAVNYVLFSVQLLGPNSPRLASGPECAQANIPGYNANKWSKIIHDYLEPNFEVVALPGPPDRGGGVYVPESIGTAQELHNRLVYNNALNAIPLSRKDRPAP